MGLARLNGVLIYTLTLTVTPTHCHSHTITPTQLVDQLICCMDDESVQVRDSTAWTIGRICEHVPTALLTEKALESLLTGLIKGLDGEPRVANNVCWVRSS